MSDYAPIVLFAYNRPDHLKATLDSLSKNTLATETELFVFADGPKPDASEADLKKIRDVREVLERSSGFKNRKIRYRSANIGLAESIISGVSEVFEVYSKVIVLEDDLVTSPDFLLFMNTVLDRYKGSELVQSITGYNFPIPIDVKYPYDIYFVGRSSSWGWATWRDRWQSTDWEVKDYQDFVRSREAIRAFSKNGDDLFSMLQAQISGKNDSWAIRWAYSHFKNKRLCAYPVVSRVQNIGHDGTGTHCEPSELYQTKMNLDVGARKLRLPENAVINREIQKQFKDFHSWSWLTRLKVTVKRFSSVTKHAGKA